MTVLYTGKGTAGPWACDDANVVCDGWLGSDGAVKPGPTVDGATHPTPVHFHDKHVREGRKIREDG